jgi:hypothetical protein
LGSGVDPIPSIYTATKPPVSYPAVTTRKCTVPPGAIVVSSSAGGISREYTRLSIWANVSRSIDDFTGDVRLPAASRNCANTVFLPSPALNVYTYEDAKSRHCAPVNRESSEKRTFCVPNGAVNWRRTSR